MHIGNIRLRFHAAGWPFIVLFIGLTVLFYFVNATIFNIAVVATLWCFYFFRDPPRMTPTRSGLVISPADGEVVAIRQVIPEPELGLGDAPRTRISIFLNVFNVHVNRYPVDGTVVGRYYRPGKFVNASLDKASVDNERMALVVQMTGEHQHTGELIGFVQIAGLVARRIVCSAQVGQQAKAGQRYGIIRFGSRADIYLPVDVQPLVSIGQTMIGGETVLADFMSDETRREGEVR